MMNLNPNAIEDDQKLLIDIRELSRLTGFSVGTLYHFAAQRKIPVVHISSRCIRFRLSDIEEWIASRVVETLAEERTK
jgi:predicted DNA-binding transcriptional regulator AlpA